MITPKTGLLNFFRSIFVKPKAHEIIDVLTREGECSSVRVYAAIVEARGTEVCFSAVSLRMQEMEREGYLTSRWGKPTAERGWRRPRLYALRDLAEC